MMHQDDAASMMHQDDAASMMHQDEAPARCAAPGEERAAARGGGLPGWRRVLVASVACAVLCVMLVGGVWGGGRSQLLTKLPSLLPVEDRGMRGLVTMLAGEAKAPGVCDKRALIIHKLEELLARLGARAVTLNDTDAQYRREAETALEVWLEVESIYRMSQEKFDEATQSSELVLQQMEVAEHVEKLCEKSVKQVIDEYPTKSAKINEEKEVVLDIIEMVEQLSFSSMSQQAAEQRMRQFSAEALAIAGKASKTTPHDEVAKLLRIKARLAQMEAGTGMPLHRERAATNKLRGGATKEDVHVTKSAVLKILFDLLKEPDFRAHLLKEGLKAAHARLAAKRAKVQALQNKEVELADQADKAKEEGVVASMERNKDAGQKVVKEEAFVSEHKEYIAQAGSNEKGILTLTPNPLSLNRLQRQGYSSVSVCVCVNACVSVAACV